MAQNIPIKLNSTSFQKPIEIKSTTNISTLPTFRKHNIDEAYKTFFASLFKIKDRDVQRRVLQAVNGENVTCAQCAGKIPTINQNTQNKFITCATQTLDKGFEFLDRVNNNPKKILQTSTSECVNKMQSGRSKRKFEPYAVKAEDVQSEISLDNSKINYLTNNSAADSLLPLTDVERRKRYLDILKASGKFEEFKKRKAADEKKRRDRINAGLETLPKNVREKAKRLKRQRKVAEFRQRKKEENGVLVGTTNQVPSVQANEGAYKTASALAKAVAKVKRALPSTSQKKEEVVAKLLKSKDLHDIVTSKTSVPKRTKGISSLDVDLVKAFYERDDISRMSPNMKDCTKFLNPSTGIKEVKQVRFLMYKLADVYEMFVKYVQNGDDTKNPPVKKSKFCQLRPSHVKLLDSTPLDQCLCLYHSNFIMCCTAINRYMPEFPKYGPKLELLILCKNPNQNCWLRKCLKCPNIEIILAEIMKRSGKSIENSVNWGQWIKDKVTTRYEKTLQRGTLENLLNHFRNKLPEFLKHSYIKRNQAASFEKDNQEVREADGKVGTLEADFAEIMLTLLPEPVFFKF